MKSGTSPRLVGTPPGAGSTPDGIRSKKKGGRFDPQNRSHPNEPTFWTTDRSLWLALTSCQCATYVRFARAGAPVRKERFCETKPKPERNEPKIERGVANHVWVDPCTAGGPAPWVPVEAICRVAQALGSREAKAPATARHGGTTDTAHDETEVRSKPVFT